MLHAGAPGIHPIMGQPAARRGDNGWSCPAAPGARRGPATPTWKLVSLEPGRQAEVGPCPACPTLDSIVINELEAGALTGIDASAPAADGPVDWGAVEAMAVG